MANGSSSEPSVIIGDGRGHGIRLAISVVISIIVGFFTITQWVSSQYLAPINLQLVVHEGTLKEIKSEIEAHRALPVHPEASSRLGRLEERLTALYEEMQQGDRCTTTAIADLSKRLDGDIASLDKRIDQLEARTNGHP